MDLYGRAANSVCQVVEIVHFEIKGERVDHESAAAIEHYN